MTTHIETGTEKMLARIDDGIGWMTYNNPARLNAVSYEMQRAIPGIMDAFGADPSVRVVVVRGAGEKSFASGADISEFGEKRTSVDARAAYDAATAAAWQAVDDFERPIIAMIHGYCLGFGLLAAMKADIRISADDGQFAIPAAKLGLGYGSSGVEMLLAVVGSGWASEILFTGRRLSADEALRIGLVNRVVAAADLEASVRELADTIAANAPLTVKAAKAAIRDAQRDPAERNVAAIEALVEACFRSDDYQEGQRAFAEQRPPRFAGN
jgi:enoyl-CoA hydratase